MTVPSDNRRSESHCASILNMLPKARPHPSIAEIFWCCPLLSLQEKNEAASSLVASGSIVCWSIKYNLMLLLFEEYIVITYFALTFFFFYIIRSKRDIFIGPIHIKTGTEKDL